jgi:hypothetical protein
MTFMKEATPEVQAFLRAFFDSEENGVSLDAVREIPALGRLVQPLMSREPRPTVLPWRKPGGKKGEDIDCWFAVARSPRELYELRSHLQAFVGTTYANVQVASPNRKKDSRLAHAVQSYTNGNVLVFRGASKEVFKGVNKWLNVRSARPAREVQETRSTGLLLRDFDAALQAQDTDRARSILSFLRNAHRLGPRNLQFLEVKVLEATGEWEKLLRHAKATQMVRHGRRPVAVTDAMLRAMYHLYLRDPALAGDVEGLRRELEELSLSLGAIWERRTGLSSPEAWMAYGLAAAFLEEDYEGLEAARDAVARLGGDASLLARLLEQMDRPEARYDDPWQAYNHADYDRALTLARNHPVKVDRARVLVLLAYELRAFNVQQEAQEAVQNLAPDEVASFNRPEMHALDHLREQLAPEEAKIKSWLDLFLSLQGDEITHAQFLHLAKEGKAAWPTSSLSEHADAVEEALFEVPDNHTDTLRDALTYFVGALTEDAEYPDLVLRGVYDAVLLHLLSTPHPEPDYFYSAIDLFPGLLGAMDAGQYGERLNDVLKLLGRTTARLQPDRLLDFVDLLVASDCPSPGTRQACVAHVEQHRQQHENRWTLSNQRFLRSLAEEIGVGDLVAPPDTSMEEVSGPIDPLRELRGRRIGIYTLTVNAGQRVVGLLEARVPDIEVKLSHAKVATDKLKAMAQRSDVFVMVTGSAKHAATGAIEANLGPQTVLVRPAGKGSSSILSALEEKMKQQAVPA